MQQSRQQELQYSDYPYLAGLLGTYLINGSQEDWQRGLAGYQATSQVPGRIVADIDALLINHAATEDALRLWVRAHASSQSGELADGVPIRLSLLELRDALLDLGD